MNKLKIIIILILAIACNQQENNNAVEFDQVTLYTIQIEDQELFDLVSQNTLTTSEQNKIDVLLNDKFENLSDTVYIKDLEAIGFTKKEANKNQLNQLQNLFPFENEANNQVNECINIYRDVLVFRKKGKIAGIAKVCLVCEAMHVVSSSGKNSTQLSRYAIEQLKQIL